MAAQRSVAPCGQAVQVASAGQMRQGLSKGGFGIYIYIYILIKRKCHSCAKSATLFSSTLNVARPRLEAGPRALGREMAATCWHMLCLTFGCKLRYTSRFVLIVAPQSGRLQKSTRPPWGKWLSFLFRCSFTSVGEWRQFHHRSPESSSK
jgi:hypothetical protein